MTEKPKFPLCSKYIDKKDMLYLEEPEWEVIELALSIQEKKIIELKKKLKDAGVEP